MGRSPWSPPSIKQDTVGGAPGLRLGRPCPDRSWCRTTSPGTHESGDPDRQTSRNVLWEEPLPALRAGGERKKKKLLGRETDARLTVTPTGGPEGIAALRAGSARFAYAAPDLRLKHSRKSWRTSQHPLLTTLIGLQRKVQGCRPTRLKVGFDSRFKVGPFM
jgi:hypothetical protein